MHGITPCGWHALHHRTTNLLNLGRIEKKGCPVGAAYVEAGSIRFWVAIGRPPLSAFEENVGIAPPPHASLTNFGDNTGANRLAAFADREVAADVKRHTIWLQNRQFSSGAENG